MKGKLQRIFRRNFKTKLIATFLLILIVPSLILGILAYNQAKHEIEKQIVDSASDNVQLVDSIINSFIQPKMNDADYFSKQTNATMYKGEDSPAIRQSFDTYLGMHAEVSSLSLGTQTGLYVRMPQQEVKADFDPRTRDWYKDAMANKGKAIITEPYISAVTGEIIVTVAKATEDSSGVVAVTLSIEQIKKLAGSVTIGKEGHVTILDKSKKYIVHPSMKSGEPAKDSAYDRLYQENSGQFEAELEDKDKKLYYTTNELVGWKIVGVMDSSEVLQSASPIYNITLWTIIVCLLIGGCSIYFILRAIIKPIQDLKGHAARVSDGILTETIHIQSNDEIGDLGRAFIEMQAHLRSLIQDVEARSELVAASSEQLTASAQQTSAVTEQVTSAVQEVASSAEKQMDSVDHNAQALQEIATGVGRIVDSVTVLSDLSKHTTMQAEEGEESVTQVVEQMYSIHESVQKSDRMIRSLYDRSKEINTISDVISGIARQTNLLALNAAIEAARAGEHGKGFAVVANEVRKLAEQSQDSAARISDLIEEIQRETKESVETTEKAARDVEGGLKVSNEAIYKFEQILSSMRKTAPHIDEVSAITEQISAGVQEVTAVANELALIARGNAATSEEVAASAEEQLASMEEISASAQNLASLSEELKALIQKFTY
ncbi:methyl-accepting chemotaxis protein [Paenibacillus sp. UNC451MF]|uniref:methyl-accepting chemotaxis protein n=1 Tax=Paenibacillus sp. UNC451MF TaxID=1449063 RepID=UPI00048D162F|nr:methyl-accepting chemotaxis protein [Paenibacillus sp. UNC451MF]